MRHQKTYLHIYTGDGKGKTTAAIGLITRAAAANLRCALIQFLKDGTSSEVSLLKTIGVQCCHFGSRHRIKQQMTDSVKNDIIEGLEFAKEKLISGDFDVIVLDEFNCIAHLNIVDCEWVKSVVKQKHQSTELIMTGRNAPLWLIEMGDVVTVMEMKKHYYLNNVDARHGIEY